MHDLSLGELQALAAKATRGAGRAVGVAEDAGRAVRWLQARGEGGADALVQLLQATDGLPARDMIPALPAFSPVKKGICPLALGGYLSDRGILPDAPIGPVWSPVLLLPFVAEISPNGADIDQRGASLRLICRSAPRVQTHTRAAISSEILNALNALAARTYAPATAQSRAGAGAGTSDNE